jgi:hypothetical protein
MQHCYIPFFMLLISNALVILVKAPKLWNRQRMKLFRGLFLLAFQNPHDGKDRVPVACGCRHTEQRVNPAKIADGFHVATVHAKDELLLRGHDSHEPLPLGRECDWEGCAEASGSRQDAHKSNNIGS